MTPTGNNILVKPKPLERKIGLIYLPDTITLKGQMWGEVIKGNEGLGLKNEIPTGSRVLFHGKSDEEQIISVKIVILWE